MIKFKSGDLFNSNCHTLVNTINVNGIMGGGIALQFKNKFPKMFSLYKRDCSEGKIKTGHVYLYKGTPNILNFPTKADWWNPSKLEYIEDGLKDFVNQYERLGITSIAFPKLGCNLGRLNWDDVKPIMVKYLDNLPIEIEIYE